MLATLLGLAYILILKTRELNEIKQISMILKENKSHIDNILNCQSE